MFAENSRGSQTQLSWTFRPCAKNKVLTASTMRVVLRGQVVNSCSWSGQKVRVLSQLSCESSEYSASSAPMT